MKILIIGSGWVGNLLRDYLDCDITTLRIEQMPDTYILPYDVVINTAGKTNIDWCEKNKVECFNSNVLAAQKLAYLCKKYGKKYVYFSSACIFDSPTVYRDEYDTPNPSCFYTETKVMAERLISEIDSSALLLRLRLPISSISHPRNLLQKLTGYTHLHNNQNSATLLDDAFPVIKELIENNASGAYHIVNEGTISPSEIADLLGHHHTVFTKEEESQMFKSQGRAKKVDSLITSVRTPLLPNITVRLKEIISQ